MDADVQRPASNPTAMLAALVSKREKLQEELRKLEDQLYELEGNYLHDSAQSGNVLKGFEGFLSSSKSTTKCYGTSYLHGTDNFDYFGVENGALQWKPITPHITFESAHDDRFYSNFVF